MTIVDVARAAGVSIATVSRVLGETGYPVRPETRRRVLQAAEQMHFRPNPLARGMITKETQTIGLLVPDIANPYYPEIARGIEDSALARKYAVMYCNTDRQAAKAAYYLDVLLQKRIDGIIATGHIGDAQQLSSASAPIVLIGRHDLPHPAVRVDNVAAAREAARHLIDGGHRRIGVISFGPGATSGVDRLSGFRAELREHGLRLDKELIVEGNFSEESGYRAAMTLLSRNAPPTAVLAMNDRMAIGAMAAAADLGICIPRDLAVVGFDDIPAASYMRPSLSSVAHPAHAMGVAAMTAMLDLLAGKPVPPITWIPTALVARESSGPAKTKRRTP